MIEINYPSRIALAIGLLSLGSCGGGGGGNSSSTAPTVAASFLVTVSASAGGTVSASQLTVKEGDSSTVTVAASLGYELASATGCGGSLSGNTFTTGKISSPCAITVNFQPASCTPDQASSAVKTVFDARKLSLSPGETLSGTSGDDQFSNRPVELNSSAGLSRNFKGGAGFDLLEGSGWDMSVYWDSPNPVIVRLDANCASDGFGSRDTLRDIRGAFGSGQSDIFFGDDRNNVFWTLGGKSDFVNGGGGDDLVILSYSRSSARITRVDSKTWTVAAPANNAPDREEIVTLENVEMLQFYDKNEFSKILLLTGQEPQEFKFGMKVQLSPNRQNVRTDFFKVEQFAFHVESIREASGRFYYPTPADVQGPGSFSLDPHNMITGDFNGDGLEDLVVSYAVFNHTISHKTPIVPTVFLSNGDGSFGSANAVMSGAMPLRHMPYRMHSADLNGDKRDDLVMGTMYNPNSPERLPGVSYPIISEPIVVLLSTPDGKLIDASSKVEGQENGAAVKGRLTSFSHDLAIGDMDGDKDIDIYTSGALLINDGTGRFLDRSANLPAEARISATGVMSSAIGDLDGDGIGDLVVAYFEGFPRYAFLSRSSGVAGAKVVQLPDGPYGRDNTKSNYMSIGDVNGDGRQDIVIAVTRALPYYQGRRIQILINHGDGVFIDESSTRLDNAPQDKHAGEGELYLRDLNSDGAVDLVHATAPTFDGSGRDTSGSLNVFLNDGKGNFRLVPPSRFAFLTRGDVDGFGFFEVVPNGYVSRSVPIKLTKTGNIDFVSHVYLGWQLDGEPTPVSIALYTMRSLRTLQ